MELGRFELPSASVAGVASVASVASVFSFVHSP